MIGPVLGGFLFEIGWLWYNKKIKQIKFILFTKPHWRGFRLPFFVMGGLLFVVFLVALFLFPDPHSFDSRQRKKHSATLPLLPLLKIAHFDLTLMMLFCGALSVTFIEPAIQLHLQPVCSLWTVNDFYSSPIWLSKYLLFFNSSIWPLLNWDSYFLYLHCFTLWSHHLSDIYVIW